MEDNMTILATNDYENDLCKKLFDKNGKIEITDLALLSGAVVNNNVEYYIWTKSGDNDNGVVALKAPFENNNWSHNTIEFDSYRREATILPTITSPDVFNDVISRNNNDEDYFEVEYFLFEYINLWLYSLVLRDSKTSDTYVIDFKKIADKVMKKWETMEYWAPLRVIDYAVLLFKETVHIKTGYMLGGYDNMPLDNVDEELLPEYLKVKKLTMWYNNNYKVLVIEWIQMK